MAAERRAANMAENTIDAIARARNQAEAAEKLKALLILAGGVDKGTAAGIAGSLIDPLMRGLASVRRGRSMMARDRSALLPTRHSGHHPGGHRRSGADGTPTLRVQLHSPVHYSSIWGTYGFTVALEAPAIYWGREGRCFAFLHDLTSRALAAVMADCAAATQCRRQPWAR